MKLENKNHTTLDTNDCNLDDIFCSIQKGKGEMTKGRKEGKSSLSENPEGMHKAIH